MKKIIKKNFKGGYYKNRIDYMAYSNSFNSKILHPKIKHFQLTVHDNWRR